MSALLLFSLVLSHDAWADGATTYASYCATCHGSSGKGDGPAAAALEPSPSDFRATDFWSNRTEAGVKKVIKEGGAATGKSPAMPGMGAVLTEAQVNELVVYLKTFQDG